MDVPLDISEEGADSLETDQRPAVVRAHQKIAYYARRRPG